MLTWAIAWLFKDADYYPPGLFLVSMVFDTFIVVAFLGAVFGGIK